MIYRGLLFNLKKQAPFVKGRGDERDWKILWLYKTI